MEKVRIGIIGTGQRICYHGSAVFSHLKKDICLSALCDKRKERLEHARKEYEKAFGYKINAYLDYKEMIGKENLDGVYIASPNYLHRDMSLHSFSKGLHVLLEKPMELTLKKCDEIIKSAKTHKKVLVMGMQMHYEKRFHKITEIINKGVIGKPTMLWCTEYRQPYMEMKDWVWEKNKSGGAIVEKNCHHYDILNMWVQSKPTTVYASGNIMKHKRRSGKKSEIVDNAWIVNDYENGARGMIGICFLAQDGYHYREFGVMGTEGKIFISSKDGETIHLEQNNGKKSDIIVSGELRGGVFKDFVDCIRTGNKPLMTGEIAKESMLIPLAAEVSIEEKRIVNINELK